MKKYLRLIMLLSSLRLITSAGQQFQYYLDIHDLLDPAWVYSEFKTVNSKIQCASLCHQDKGKCAYFGYKEKVCYLLKDTVNELSCSKDDCSDAGMKVYKWKIDVPTTTKSAESTSTTTTATTETETTTTEGTLTTSEVAVTKTEAETSTTEGQTTTLEAATTTTKAETTTTEAATTTTEDTTTTTEAATTTTEDTTTTTEAATTTTEDTTTTTEAATTTTETTSTTTDLGTTSTTETTTVEKTTTTVEKTTTTDPTTTEGEFVCDLSNNAVETKASCSFDSHLLNSLTSRSPFFMDGILFKCSDVKEKLYSDEEQIFVFYSLDGGISITAYCPEETQVIVKLKICVKETRVPVITLHCNHILEKDKIEDVYNVTINDVGNNVMCEDKSAIQKMYFMDAGNGVNTRVNFTCVKLYVEEESIAVPDKPSGGV